MTPTEPEIAYTAIRVALGVFFGISGYHKITNPLRHNIVLETMRADRVPYPVYAAWLIPCIELDGGIGLVLGLATQLSALGLLCICLGATVLDGLKRIPIQHPIDRADYLDDILYLPETLYCACLLVPLFCGPGRLSLDYLLDSYLRGLI